MFPMTKKLTLTALTLALSTALSMIVMFRMPFDGAVTPGSMVPVIFIAIIYGRRWGVLTGAAHGIIQMLLMFAPPPARGLLPYIAVVMLDYIIAFGVLGLAGLFYRVTENTRFAVQIAGAAVVFLRFLCHLISGVIIWGSYAPEGQNVFVYSLLYNGSYMLPEMVITVILLSVLGRFIKNRRF